MGLVRSISKVGRREIEISTLLESMPEGVLIVDSAGTVQDANAGAERFLRCRIDELRGTAVAELSTLVGMEEGGRPLEFPRYAVTRALQGESVRNERRSLRSSAGDGEAVEALVSASPIRDEGKIVGAVLVIRDISELTQLQKRLNDTERHRAIGQMAAGLAHDFNNVLDTIEKAVAVMELRADASPERRRTYLQMIHNAVRRGAEIIARLRQYLKDGSGQLEPVDLKVLLEETVELMQPVLHEAGNVRLTTRLQPVPRVRGNSGDLRRVLTNLLVNAMEAMPQGGELEVGVAEQNGHVQVYVCDTGVGIPRENQKKVFYPYFTTKPAGTGLGLSGAQRVVLSYGGNIRVLSEPGKGTRFTIELPVIEATEPGQRPPLRPNGNGGGGGESRKAA